MEGLRLLLSRGNTLALYTQLERLMMPTFYTKYVRSERNLAE